MGDHVQQVASHYNAIESEGRQERSESRIVNLRKFNNWVKSVLINLHTRPGDSVLDLCCGKGGDLTKWAKSNIGSYIGCDIAAVSLREAARRYNDSKSTNFPANFFVGDCFGIRIADYLDESIKFDVASCQFSMHYAFGSEECVKAFLLNVSERLRPGGFFIGTTPDSNVVVRKLRAVDGLSIQNEVYFLELGEEFKTKRFSRHSPYGIRYKFTLDSRVEDCPEYLVHFPSFAELAKQYDLELVMQSNFHDFYLTYCTNSKYGQLFRRLNVLDQNGTIPLDQWDACYLYTAFAFKKIGNPNLSATANGPSGGLQQQHRDVESIVDLTGQRPVEIHL